MKKEILGGLFALFLTACSLLSTEREYEIRLPSLPEAYGFIESWDVEVLFLQGGESRFSVDGDRSGFTLTVGKEEGALLIATARGPDRFALKPAALFLDGFSEKGGELSFDDGPAGAVLETVFRQGVDLRRFNVSRFFRQFNRNDLPSPWFVDLAGIAEKIIEGEMTLRCIRAAPLFELETGPDGEGWLGGDPLLGRGIPSRLPAGTHRFYDPENGRIREIVLDDKGYAVVMDYSVRNR